MEGNMKTVSFCTLLGVILRWAVSLFPYSGQGKPPMYGDYEAQRHWQEITTNLATSEWYQDTEDNDLQYWGLDYPPLTAYHSLLCGLIASYINPDFVALYYSRGYESPEHKLFMRFTVLFADLLIYFPAALYFLKSKKNTLFSQSGLFSCFSALMLYPGIYIIDYGHFQYNNVSLGLFILAVTSIFNDCEYLGAMFFSLALNYKQMELYHALPFFFYLLGKSFQGKTMKDGLTRVSLIGAVVITTFIFCWAPFLTDLNTFFSVIDRLFPVNRGIYEDKVASFWCSISVIFKLKSMFENSTMAVICFIATFISVIPSCYHLLMNPKPTVFKYALINVSFLFFLFSFHVHEKSILLVALPACFVFNEEPLIITWFFISSIFSIIPLLIKDGLIIPAISFSFLTYLFYLFSFKDETSRFSLARAKFCKNIFYISLFTFGILILSSIFIDPPERYPDLFPVLISTLSCLHFSTFCLYFHYCQFTVVNYDALKPKQN